MLVIRVPLTVLLLFILSLISGCDGGPTGDAGIGGDNSGDDQEGGDPVVDSTATPIILQMIGYQHDSLLDDYNTTDFDSCQFVWSEGRLSIDLASIMITEDDSLRLFITGQGKRIDGSSFVGTRQFVLHADPGASLSKVRFGNESDWFLLADPNLDNPKSIILADATSRSQGAGFNSPECDRLVFSIYSQPLGFQLQNTVLQRSFRIDHLRLGTERFPLNALDYRYAISSTQRPNSLFFGVLRLSPEGRFGTWELRYIHRSSGTHYRERFGGGLFVHENGVVLFNPDDTDSFFGYVQGDTLTIYGDRIFPRWSSDFDLIWGPR